MKTYEMRSAPEPPKHEPGEEPDDETGFLAILDRVLVIPDEPDDKIGTILLPDNAKVPPTSGLVYRKGDDCRFVKKGDRVWYSRWAGTDVEAAKGVVIKVLTEKDVLTLVRPQKKTG